MEILRAFREDGSSVLLDAEPLLGGEYLVREVDGELLASRMTPAEREAACQAGGPESYQAHALYCRDRARLVRGLEPARDFRKG